MVDAENNKTVRHISCGLTQANQLLEVFGRKTIREPFTPKTNILLI